MEVPVCLPGFQPGLFAVRGQARTHGLQSDAMAMMVPRACCMQRVADVDHHPVLFQPGVDLDQAAAM